MSANVRRNLAVQLVAGGDNPLRLRLIVNPSIMPIRIGQTIAAGLLALVAQGGSPAYSYSISSGSLPAGLELDEATGYITGTVASLADSAGTSNAGFHGFVAQVEDSSATVFEDGFSITVEHVISWVQDEPPTKNEVGIPFSYIFKATGAGANVSYSIHWSFGAPAWATFTSDGRLSGTPASTAFSVPYTVTATDSVSGDEITYDGDISTVAAVTLLPITGVIMPVSSNFSGAVVETGLTTGVRPFVFRIDQRTLPAGVVGGITVDTTDPRIGVISLISSPNAFTGSIDINVTDALGATASTTIDIATFIPNQQLNAGDGATSVFNPNAITFDPATFDVTDDGSGGLHVVGLGGGDSGGGFGNQVITADDEFGNSVINPSSLRIYSDDASVDVLGEVGSDGGISWRLRSHGAGAGLKRVYQLPITATGGEDTLTLGNTPIAQLGDFVLPPVPKNGMAMLEGTDLTWSISSAGIIATLNVLATMGDTYGPFDFLTTDATFIASTLTSSGNDPHFSHVVSLLHFNGTNGSTTITDQISGVTWACGGSAALATAQKLFGTASLDLSPSTWPNYIVITSGGSVGKLDAREFTLEISIYVPTLPSAGHYPIIASRDSETGGARGWQLLLNGDSSGRLEFRFFDSGGTRYDAVSATAVSTSTWQRVRVCRASDTLYLFLEGTLVGTQALPMGAVGGDPSNDMNIGQDSTGVVAPDLLQFHGYLDEWRLTMDVARSTSNYTVDAQPFPDS